MLLLWSSYVWVGSAAITRAPVARLPVPQDDDEDILMFNPPPEGWRIISPRRVVTYRSDDANTKRNR